MRRIPNEVTAANALPERPISPANVAKFAPSMSVPTIISQVDGTDRPGLELEEGTAKDSPPLKNGARETPDERQWNPQ